MKVKHLDELYTWKQIRRLQLVYDFNPHNGFIPVALCAPGEGHTSHYGGSDDHYEWYGKRTAYCAKRLWEVVRKELADVERDALAFDIVEASECFNTVRFRDKTKVQNYLRSFKDSLRRYADSGKLKSAIGRAPARPYPWEPAKRYEEVIIDDDADYRPGRSHSPQHDKSILDYVEFDFPGWTAVKQYFIELTEDELAFLNGEEIINKQPSPLDMELVKACFELDVKNVSALLESGVSANVNSGGQFPDTLISCVLEAAYDLNKSKPDFDLASQIIDMLLYYGCDIDYCPYGESAPLYEATYYDTSCIKFLLEKGANPNSICWIDVNEIPQTPLDSIADDIVAYGEEEDLKMRFDLIERAGGKFFSELVPDFCKV